MGTARPSRFVFPSHLFTVADHEITANVGGFLTYIASTNAATANRRPELSFQTAQDIFWMLTGGDVYRMLVSERGWSPHKYQDWLADTLVESLLAPIRRSRVI